MPFREISVDPVRNVERAVCTEREEIVRRDRLGLASTLQHEKLGENGDGFKPDRERPEDLSMSESYSYADHLPVGYTHLSRSIFVGQSNSQNQRSTQQVLHFERVEVRVIGGLVVVEHQIDDVGGRCNENDLEDGVVEHSAVEGGPEEVCGIV